MNHCTWSGRTRAALTVCVGVLLFGFTAHAQQWQSLAGGVNVETGDGGVQVVSTGGYISVGSTTSFTATADVYITKWNGTGGLVWGFAYDFGLNANEYGYDIQECANGDFIVTGRTTANGSDLILLRIMANGNVIWGRTFGGAGYEAGYDVIEAANGDIVAAGEAHPVMAANQDGLVVRTTGAGATVFVSTYQPPNGLNDVFLGLDEAANADLIVCGTTTSFNGFALQGWLLRLTPAGAVNWAVHDGGPANEIFNSVIELQVNNQAGNIVAVGSTTSVAPADMYAVKYTGAGGKLADLCIGTPNNIEEAFQVREAQNIPTPGDLLLTGHTNPGPLGGDDAYAVDISPVWFAPPVLINWSMAYGGIGLDQLASGDEDPTQNIKGFILCGTTQSANLLPAGDPQQMYVIRTNIFGVSRCNESRMCDRTFFPNLQWFQHAINVQNWNWNVLRNLNRPNGAIWQNLCFTAWPLPPGPIAPPPNHNGDGQTPVDHSTSGSLSDVAPQDVHSRELTNTVTTSAATATTESLPGNQR